MGNTTRMRGALNRLLSDGDTRQTKDYGLVCCEREDGTGLVLMGMPRLPDPDIYHFMVGAGAASCRAKAGGQTLGLVYRGESSCEHPECVYPLLIAVTPDQGYELWTLAPDGCWLDATPIMSPAFVADFVAKTYDSLGRLAVNHPHAVNVAAVGGILDLETHELDYGTHELEYADEH